MKKRLFSTILCFVTALTLLAPITGTMSYATDTNDSVAEILRKSEPKADAFGFADKKGIKKALKSEASMPESFDLRNVNGNNYVTPVKFQNPFGTCWGFAAISAAETGILSSGLAEEAEGRDVNTLDLSEKHLAYFSNQMIEDKTSPQFGEGTGYPAGTSTKAKLNTGGLPLIASSLFADGVGVNSEYGTDPFTGGDLRDIFGYFGKEKNTVKTIEGEDVFYSANDDWDIPAYYRNFQSYVLSEAVCLPSPAGRNDVSTPYKYAPEATAAIKDELLDNKSVVICFAADDSMPGEEADRKYIDLDNWAHYTYDENEKATHAVAIIGWDDNYPASNFTHDVCVRDEEDNPVIDKDGNPVIDPDSAAKTTPSGNGAWLVKNSWGSEEREFPNKGLGWGMLQDPTKPHEPETNLYTGYFWLSYYDKSLSYPETYVFDKANTEPYYLDQHDLMPATAQATIQSEEKVSMANVFTAEGHQKLEYVACQPATPGTVVTYEVYLLDDNNKGPLDGTKVAELKTSAYKYGGYYKEKLDTPVHMKKGQKYSIVVSMMRPDNQYDIAFDAGLNEKGNPKKWSIGIINPGESYIVNAKGGYRDLAEYGTKRLLLSEEDLEVVSIDNFSIKGFSSMASEPPAEEKPVLAAKGIAKGSTAAVFSWNKVSGADRYVIYLAKCNYKGKKYALKKVKTVNAKTLKWTKTKLAKNTAYKFYVAAQKKSGGSYKTIAKSRAGHFITGNVRGKYTNPKSLSPWEQ